MIEKQEIKLSVPSSWEFKLLEGLSGLKQKSRIFELFGSLQRSPTGSSRSIFEEDCRTKNQLEKYVEVIHKFGFKFNYILNSSCLGNREYNLKYRKEILSYLSWIASTADYVTIAMPYLAELMINEFSISVVASTVAGIDSVKKAMMWDEIGVKRIVLDFSANRDFELLKNIVDSVNCEIELILNDGCLLRCPYRQFHSNAVSHSSQGFFWLPYEVLKCLLHRAKHPEEYIMAPWIRPEDLKFYTELGIKHFKISGRGKNTEFILNCANAYSEGKYEGNLADILTLVTASSHFIGDMVVNESPDVSIDNRKLDGFIEFFKKNRCVNCKKCGYCGKIASEAVEIKGNIVEYISELENLLPFILHFEKSKYRYRLMKTVSDIYSSGRVPPAVFKKLSNITKPLSSCIIKKMNQK